MSTDIFGNLSHFSSKIAPASAPTTSDRDSAPYDGAPYLELIIKVEILPNMDRDEGGADNTTDPFVRIRLKEIDSPKVFIHINCHVLVYCIVFVFMTKCTPKFLKKFECETTETFDSPNAFFGQKFKFENVRVHLFLLSFFCD